MEKYIKELLFEHDCVIVPGLGAFLTQYISSDIHPITHKFTPPSRKPAFNEQLQTNDGLLITAVSLAENISREDAQAKVKAFVEDVKAHLNRINLYEFDEIGRIFYNTHDCLEFEPDTSINYLDESYGLPELFFKPIERNFTTTMNKPTKPDRPVRKPDTDPQEIPKSSNTGLIIFAIFFLLFSGATAFFYLNQDNQDLASINPFVLFKDKKEVVADVPESPAPEPVVAEPEPVIEEEPKHEDIITAETGRFFVIVGSFKNRENAYKMKDKFEMENQMVSVIEPYNKKNYYRVAVADFETKEIAKSRLKELKATYGNSIWILSY